MTCLLQLHLFEVDMPFPSLTHTAEIIRHRWSERHIKKFLIGL